MADRSIRSLTHTVMEDYTSISVKGAGIVLFSPFLPRLFMMLDLISDNKFNDEICRQKAIVLICYLLSGNEQENCSPELIQILTGLNSPVTFPLNVVLTEHERQVADSMIRAAIYNWEKLKNTSIDGIREAFLQREGKLELKENYFELSMEKKSYDVLLDSLPWSYSNVKYEWMKKLLHVKWR